MTYSGGASEPVAAQGEEAPIDPRLLAAVEKARGFSAAVGRGDLAGRLEQTRARLLDPHVRVLVLGQFKQGKSKLVNALVNAPACPIDDDIATSVPTSVGYGDTPSAVVLKRSDEDPDTVERVPIALEELSQYVSEKGNPDNERDLLGAEVLLPREILRGGLRLVDSPGVGGLESTRSLSTLAALPTAHAILLVSDASQEYTDPEVQFLQHAMRISPNIAAVLSKTDIYPEWRQIESLDRSHLGAVGEIPIFAVSSDLRLLAAEAQDRELNTESGFPALVAHLRRDVLGRAESLHRRAAMHDLVSVTDQLSMSIQSELAALLHPEDTPRMIAQLEEARSRADDFRSRSSRWQVALSDGIADLISDTEHDLRDRLRGVQREAEAAIDEGDPGPIWDQIAEWLDTRVSAAVAETFVWTNERSQWLCEAVADQFTSEESSLPSIDVGDTSGLLDPVDGIPGLDSGQMGTVEKIYIGVRGSYGGILMTGLATSLVGLSLINPLSLLVGVLVGRRAFREDMTARLTRRQMEAKNIVRRHIDEVVFQVGKQLKDRLRLVQRVGRDHFGGIADELHRSLSESVLAAKQAAATFSADRDERVRMLQARQQRLDALRQEVQALAPPEPTGAGRR
ncbi:dynamin family protein [Microbacterium fluvii]|uniref:Dynamin family protein n=1 Tax=Microbacterium fluvii TaxID=415215 RepID=A0ABW2HAZ1_9MICO|nr:dynamin family protein [Microbacterium fluvii]MCU4671227.1 dynamin family protein [Microbacterium fluvii]